MPSAYQMPWATEKAIELSKRTYRKQVLPKGSITYKGRTLTFDDAFLSDLATSFVDRAYDQVPFLLADKDNGHTLDPERFRGEVKALETTDDGLYAVVEFATDEAAAAVLANPSLGVSARIVEGYDRADGKKFGRALQHVLGTLDPRVPGMKPWEAVADLSGSSDLIDLTGSTIKKEGDMPEITDEQRAAFDAYVNELAQFEAAGGGTGAGDGTGGTGGTGDEPTDEELAALLASLEDEPAGAALSNEQRQAIELANARASEAQNQVAALRAEADLARFERERIELANQGVPPVALDAWMPLMLGEHSIELANGSTQDAGEVFRNGLKAFIEAGGLVDLSSETKPAPGSPASDKTKSLLDQWEDQFPTKGRAAASNGAKA